MRTKVAAAFAGAILLVVLGAATTFWSFNQMKEAAEARKHTNFLISSSDTLLSKLKDAETGQRGYLLTGNESFLQPYLEVRDSIKSDLENLSQHTRISAAHQYLETLAPIVDAKLAELSRVIEMRRKHDATAALAIVSSGQGKRLMDSIRDELHAYDQLEEDTLTLHEAEYQSNMRLLFILIMCASLVALLIALAFAYFIYRQTQQRLMNLVHVQTVHLLESQQESNKQLQQANSTLQESEEKLAVTLHSIGDAVIATDADATVTLMNPLAEQLTGWTQAFAIGCPVGEVFHIINKDTRRLATIPVLETLAHGTIQGLANHTVLIARDGSERDIADSCAPIRDHEGRVIGAVLVFRDVTEDYALQHTLSKQRTELEAQNEELLVVQESLSISQARYFDLYDLAPVGYVTVSEPGVILEANLTSTTLLGMEMGKGMRHGLSKQLFTRFIFSADQDKYYLCLKQLIATGQSQDCELRMLKNDGTQIWMQLSITTTLDNNAPVLRIVMVDIDKRKQAEEALLKAGALQSAIFNSANFSSIATDAKGVIQIFNVGAEHMLGYAAADVMNKITPADISDPQEVIERAKALSDELDTQIRPGFEALVFKASRGIEDIYELTYIRKDGSRFPAVVSVTALRDARDAIIGYLLIGTDNTARKQIEEERVRLFNALQENNVELETAKAVAEKASLAKSVFLSSMSHELRTPLNAILGFAQLLENGPPQPTDAQLIKLHQVIKAGWYLLELINEILDLAVIESGKLALSQEAVSLAEVMHECQGMIEAQAQKRGIHIDFLPFDNTWYIYADRTRMKQALINLLTNAVKYNREQGTVEVKCTCTPKCIRISIKDSGEGLSPDKLLQLFQPFNRLGQENGTEEGTGIGLVVTKQVIELMGGTIFVESTVGVGSEFLIELIRDVAPQLANGNNLPVKLASQPHGNTAIRILLYVEDNPANLMLVEQIIEENSQIRMLSAINGNIGIALARAHLPDVILMDINLPGMSGVEAMKILRQDPATAHIPVVALSANAMPRDIEKGLEAGFFRYLTKPIKINEFMQALNEALTNLEPMMDKTT